VPSIPRDKSLDSAIALLREGNTFISQRCMEYQTDIFETRLLFKKTFCMTGEDAAREFYREGRFTRNKAIPPSVLRLLQDKGSVATLDDEHHHQRKKMFMSLMRPEAIASLCDLTEKHWHSAVEKWQHQDGVKFFDQVQKIIFKAVCEWCGISLRDVDVAQRTREIGVMIDGAGAIGPRNWRGTLLRQQCEAWLRELVVDVRAGRLTPDKDSALLVFSWHEEVDESSSDGQRKLLDKKVVAVELLNILRPTVAVARYVLFAALALYRFPECKKKLLQKQADYNEFFVQEVRRYFPFFPFIGGIVREGFEWNGFFFPAGVRGMLDVYGTTHDSRIWKEPHSFEPERFRDWESNAYSFIPQGGGDYIANHRCAGEKITIEMMKRFVHLLVDDIDYDVVDQDYEIDLSRMPALPKNDLLLRNVVNKSAR